jgi:uncharacterized Fe-S radical SAM superfamily protein PflX
VLEWIILVSACIAGGCGIVITKNMYGNSNIHGKLKNRYDEYIFDLEKENKRIKGKMNQLKQGPQISADSAENPMSAIGEIISQFAPMLPKSIRGMANDPKVMEFISKQVEENPDMVKGLIEKFVTKGKIKSEEPTDEIGSV